MHQDAEFELDPRGDRKPMKTSESGCDVIPRAETENEPSSSIHDAL